MKQSCAVCGIGVSGHFDSVGYVCRPCGQVLIRDYAAKATCSCSGDYYCLGWATPKDQSMVQGIEKYKRERDGYCPQCGERH